MTTSFRSALIGSVAALLMIAPALGQQPGAPVAPGSGTAAQSAPRPILPQAFSSPEEGFAALAAAARTQDERAMLRILGTTGRRLIRSGDPVADRAARERFAQEYAAGHKILRPAQDRAELQIGEDDWPLPLPMVRRDGRWRFDSAVGTEEIAVRRIGRNELDTIETLRAIGDAQDDFARTAGRQGAFRAYARRFFSTPGRHDGLYWPSAEGQPESPLGPLAAAASAGGYARGRQGDAPQPFHGYIFRILESQGPAAPGGTMSYVVNGRMIGGFAVIAHPAVYGSTGIKTFMINHEGTVWEQDLGPDTASEAAAITSFDPGEGWEKVPE